MSVENPPPPPGEWHTVRRDDHLSAHCSIPGRITTPRLLWNTAIGGTHQIVVSLDDGSNDFLLCYGGVILRTTLAGQTVWKSEPRGFHGVAAVADLDGTGVRRIVAANGHELFVLDAASGAVRWSYWIGPPEFYGIYASTVRAHRFFAERSDIQLIVPALHHRSVLMFDFSDGADHGRLLHQLTMGDAFHATVVIGDVDRDGTEEIVVTRLGSVAVFDPRTGGRKCESTWETDGERRRGYGQLVLHDVDGDGDLELVVLAEHVTRHLAVLDNDGDGRFTPLWDRLVEHIYPDDRTEVQACHQCVGDIDGDGVAELVVSLFNDRNDGRWHTEIINAVTGGVKWEIPDIVVDDVQRGIGDHGFELFAHTSRNRTDSRHSTLHRLRISEGGVSSVWTRNDARFAHHTIGQSTLVGKYRPTLFGDDAVWTHDDGYFVFDARETLMHVDTRSLAERVVHPVPTEDIPAAQFLVAMIEDHCIVSGSTGALTIVDSTGKSVSLACGISLATDGHPVERPSPTPVVFTHDRTTFIAVSDNGNSVALYNASAAGHPRLLWRTAGRGRIGYDRTHHSVSIADINRDGKPELLLAAPDACSVITALDLDGRVVVRHALEDQPPITAAARIGAYDWITFSDGGRMHIMISSYASRSMNSESTRCLDAMSGEVLWNRTGVGQEIEGVGFGPWGLTSVDGDTGYFCAKAYLCVVNLLTGELRQPINLLTDRTREALIATGAFTEGGPATLVTKDDPFTAYGSVVLCDVDRDGVLELVVMGCLGGFGVVNADGSTRWWKSAPLTDSAYHMGGICDVDGDGKLELGVGHAGGAFICYDADTGDERWTLRLGSTSIDCSTCDIDGDGRDEFICRTTDGRLCAIGVDHTGQPIVKWSMQFDYAVGNPVIADIDGDGLAEILAVLGDGTMIAVK